MGLVVLGAGTVGAAVASAAEAEGLGPVVVLTRSTHPALAERGPAAVAAVATACAAVGATALVNAVGRLAGSDDELDDANAAWATWVASAVLPEVGLRLVHLGSAAEYGDPGSASPVGEDHPLAPASPYGRSKAAGSAAVLAARAAGADAVVARVFNVAGPDLAPSSPLRQIRDDVLALPARGGSVMIGQPATIRDYVPVTDLGRAVARLAAHAGPVPAAVNVCSGTGVSFGDLALALGRAVDRPVAVASLGWGGIPAVVGDPTRLARATGVRPDGSAAAVVAACLT